MSNSVLDTQRFTSWKDVPIVRFAIVMYNHPDIEMIHKAYEMAGAGLGIQYKIGKEIM